VILGVIRNAFNALFKGKIFNTEINQYPLKEQYERHGLNMMFEHAKFDDGSNGVEAGLMEMLDRMKSGKLKVFKNCDGRLYWALTPL
jgi:hypothetical protein